MILCLLVFTEHNSRDNALLQKLNIEYIQGVEKLNAPFK